ncbi:MAG: succinyl-diaminopimelate desuccinylase [Acidimicrobiia bacterium]|nr:succinyl-diaminopimelate desuccinylase [Acidimicrobiia bacterium]
MTSPVGASQSAETDLLALTAELVDRPSVSFEEGPFVDWLEAELRRLPHLTVTRIGDNLVARTDLGRSQRLVLAGHTDTVPVSGNGEARIDGDVLWGLGSADMKGGLAVFLDLARTVPEPEHDLTFVFYAREEVAHEHSGLAEILAVQPELLAGDCALLGEPTSAAIEAGCQGALRFEVVLTGARAHTARPWMGRNAVHRLAPVLAELAGYRARRPVIDGCEYREALQAVSVEGGVAGNVVPDSVTLRIHHRYAPDRTAAEAEAFVRGLLAPHIEHDDRIDIVDSSSACAPSLTHPLLRRLVDDNGLEVRAKLGWTDVARFDELGIPATNFGPGDATVAHTPGERLERASVERHARALRALLTEPGPVEAS